MRGIASVGGLGLLPGAPGTYGALAALPMAYGLHALGGFVALALATALVFGLGWWVTAQLTTAEDHDPGWIVIDEVIGQWIALFPVSYGALFMGIEVWRLWPGWIAGFVLFRLFDIWKPWLVGRADRLGTPLGVMLDDAVAGVLAALGTIALATLYHGVLM